MVQLVEKRERILEVGITTYHLHLKGRVQGVGFRPYVYRFARECGLKGSVRNDMDGVHVYFNSKSSSDAEKIARKLIHEAPGLSIIKNSTLSRVNEIDFLDFNIEESQSTHERKLMITPDLAMCDTCREEMLDPNDRRYGYPFITCTNCGPRYSIMKGLPYDRPLTTMTDFNLCAACDAEYNDIENRRHYSQTNSCPICPVSMSMYDAGGHNLVESDNAQVLGRTVEAIADGRIVAMKGIGGYLLMADATRRDVIARLRRRKRRPRKPFALMYPNAEILSGDVHLSEDCTALMRSPESPIVLLPLKRHPESGIAVNEICPGLNKVGAMLPYAGVFEFLLKELGRPVIATSGNISDSPIVFNDHKAIVELSGIADYIAMNDREICIPQDDSVVRPSSSAQNGIIIRRSRGMAPSLRWNPVSHWNQNVMSTGADLKGAFGIQANGELYISQYLGNLEYIGSQQSYQATYDHLNQLLNFTPELIVSDLHPGYFSLNWAEEQVTGLRVPLLRVQHHVAHFCSVIGENDLMDSAVPILGVIWDGTGYGMDSNIWGGEFFEYCEGQLERTGHFKYFPHLFGDKMSREPRLSAFSLLGKDPAWSGELRTKFTEAEFKIYRQMKPKGLQTSSAGRLFDAVASILGLCDVMDYEGEAAILLEESATARMVRYGNSGETYRLKLSDRGVFDWKITLEGIKGDLDSGTDIGEIALRFHNTLVKSVKLMAGKLDIRHIAFSGGCFQNALLASMCKSLESEGFTVYFHKELSPNDENIAHGQIVYAYLKSLNGDLKYSK